MRWLEAEWRAGADAWIRERARVRGPIEQPHVRPWSTAMRVPTVDGEVWFKAVAPVQGFEPKLAALLSEQFPDRVTAILAIDEPRGWMLMRDAGTRLRELDPEEKLRRWEAILPRYSEIQIALASRRDELLALGVPDERLRAIPDKVEALLADEEALLLGTSGELTHEQRDQLRARMPELRALVAELEAYGVPDTIQHDDLHDGQVFIAGGRSVISDWGDSCVSHPFHSLTVTLRAIAWAHELEPGAEALLRLRDAYLEPFGVPAAAADLGYRIGTLGRALAYHRYLETGDPELQTLEYKESVPYGLRLYLEGGPIGTWN